MLSLALPLALLLLPLPWVIWRFVPPFRDQVRAIRIPFFRTVTHAAGIEARQGAVILKRSRFQVAVAIAVWILLVIALVRPQNLGEPEVVETAARDMVLALDISGSMDQRDFVGSDGKNMQRLEAVKEVLRSFISQRDGDRMALIIFGTRAFVQAPFTEDLESLVGFLDQTVVGMAGPNTALGDSIGLAIRTFEASEVDQRLMILLSDGADTSSRMTPINASALAADRGVSIYTIGVGDPGGSGEGQVDLEVLEKIAQSTGGGFFFADDQNALGEVYARIDELNPREVETISFRPTIPLVHYPLGAALVLILASITGLHLTKQRKGRQDD